MSHIDSHKPSLLTTVINCCHYHFSIRSDENKRVKILFLLFWNVRTKKFLTYYKYFTIQNHYYSSLTIKNRIFSNPMSYIFV